MSEMDDGEIRQAMTALETYNQQLESLGRQVQILRASMDDAVRARETLKALKDAEAGDDVLLPIGASSFVNVKISDDTRVITNVGSRVSVEKTIDEALAYTVETGDECSSMLNTAIATMRDIEALVNEVTAAVQDEYRNRQMTH
ncbi:MAG: prefoldin subunit alpha [Euryarchaeota archaeon]|nr:prefoldin subunit alpha [Euryarchaeota archaeon]